MINSEKKKSELEKAGEDLLDFAVDREDVKWLMDRLPAKADIKRVTVEYELQILKERLDTYVAALSKNPDAPEPALVIGPEFARICGNVDDVFTFMTGSKMFISTINKVKAYLEAIKLR